MPIDTKKIRQVIRTQLLTVTTLPPATNRAWENRDFKIPSDQSIWIRETLLPITERKIASDQIEFTGFMQYDIFSPTGKGTEDAEALADAIKEKFSPNHLQGQSITVTIDRAERLLTVPEKAWNMIPVRVLFRSYATA